MTMSQHVATNKPSKERRYVYSFDRIPYIVNSLPICERILTSSFRLAIAELFGTSSWEDLLKYGAHWSQTILRCVEGELFDADHFISVHCGTDTSRTHPQGCGLVDPLSALMFPFLEHENIFPSAPVSVSNMNQREIAAVGQRYHRALDSLGSMYGSRERGHFKVRYFPEGQVEPIFELGCAMDAKAHISSTIMELVTKQRLSLYVESNSPLWKYFDYSFFRSFVVVVVRLSNQPQSNTTLPTLSDVACFLNLIKSRLAERRERNESELLSAIRRRPVKIDASWIGNVFEPLSRRCCRAFASEPLILAQLSFLNELLECVPDCGELLRLMSADLSSCSGTFAPNSYQTQRQSLKILTPALYQT